MEKHEEFLTLSRYKNPHPYWRGIAHAVVFFGLGFMAHWLLF